MCKKNKKKSTCNYSIHDIFTDSLPWLPHHAAVVPTVAPSCVPHVTMRHSLAKPQASGMHVALDRLPAPGLAAPRHHAPHAVAATGPCPSPRASTTPAVTGPRWGSSTTLPTLIHSPTGWNGGVGRRQGKHGQTDPREGTNKTKKREIDERQTHRAGEQKCYELVKSMTKTLHRHSV